MQNNNQSIPSFHVLEQEQVEKIHQGVLQVLEKTGLKFLDERAIELLKKAGIKVDGNIAYFNEKHIQNALETAPKAINMYDRSGENLAMELTGSNSYYGTGSDCLTIIDIETEERRIVVKKDIGETAALCDGLEHIDFIMSLGLASDSPKDSNDIHQYEAMLRNSTKPLIYTAHHAKNIDRIFELSAAFRDQDRNHLRSKPNCLLYAEPNSPLTHSVEALDKLLFCAEESMPVIYVPAVLAGASGPISIAGIVVQGIAECLSGLVVHQLKNPGAPFVYGGGYTILDMRTTVVPYAAPEHLYAIAMVADMTHKKYHLPMFCAGGFTDSKVYDTQAAMEASVSTILPALSGSNLIHDLGYQESGLTASYQSLVVLNEFVSQCKRIRNGVGLEKEQLAVDVIHEVGSGGSFLQHDHTIRNYRTEVWYPDLMDRDSYPGWKEKRNNRLEDRAKKRALMLLKDHKRPLPDADQEKIITKIMADFQ